MIHQKSLVNFLFVKQIFYFSCLVFSNSYIQKCQCWLDWQCRPRTQNVNVQCPKRDIALTGKWCMGLDNQAVKHINYQIPSVWSTNNVLWFLLLHKVQQSFNYEAPATIRCHGRPWLSITGPTKPVRVELSEVSPLRQDNRSQSYRSSNHSK